MWRRLFILSKFPSCIFTSLRSTFFMLRLCTRARERAIACILFLLRLQRALFSLFLSLSFSLSPPVYDWWPPSFTFVPSRIRASDSETRHFNDWAFWKKWKNGFNVPIRWDRKKLRWLFWYHTRSARNRRKGWMRISAVYCIIEVTGVRSEVRWCL